MPESSKPYRQTIGLHDIGYPYLEKEVHVVRSNILALYPTKTYWNEDCTDLLMVGGTVITVRERAGDITWLLNQSYHTQ